MDLELLGKEPVRQDQPTGTDVRYDPDFEKLQAEVDKLYSPSKGGTTDWGEVVKQASGILDQKSKDILVAGYLAVALVYTRQVEGFSIGLKIYRDLLEQFWENLYPAKSRMRARISAMEWWIEKTQIALQPLEGAPVSQDQLNLLQEQLKKIEEFFHQNLESPLSLSAISGQLELFSKSSPPPPPSEKPVEVTPSPREKPSASEKTIQKEPEVSVAIASVNDAQRVLNLGLQKIREVTAYLFQEDLSNPLAYRWSRIAAWSEVKDLPPATNGQTRIPSPPAQIRNIFNDLKNKGDDENLLRSAESRFPQFIFWFDLNRWIAEALTNLGEQYQRANETVQQETAYLIYRLPGLDGLSFADGTPFADPETKKWLTENALRIGSGAEGILPITESVSKAQDEDIIGKEVKEAQGLIKKGKILEAVEGLQQKFRNSFSEKEKLLWRLALSQLLMNNKQSKLALPYLEQIIKDIDGYKLEAFDPELAIKGMKVVWVGLQSQPDPSSKEKAEEMYHRIAKLDLTEAIRMGKVKQE